MLKKLLPLIFVSSSVMADGKLFKSADIELTHEIDYSFDMKIKEKDNSSLSLSSLDFYKEQKIIFSSEKTAKESPYKSIDGVINFGKFKDPTITLTGDLKINFSKYGSKNEAITLNNLRYTEGFEAVKSIKSAIELSKVYQNSSEKDKDLAATYQQYFAHKYIEYEKDRSSLALASHGGKYFTSELSEGLVIEKSNLDGFAEFESESGKIEELSSFTLSNDFQLGKLISNFALPSKRVDMAYFVFLQTNIYPTEVARASENDALLSPLNCKRKSKELFSCKMKYRVGFKFTMPSTVDLNTYKMPKFIHENAKMNGGSNKELKEFIQRHSKYSQ